MKRFSALLLALAMIISLVACGGAPTPVQKDYTDLMNEPIAGEITLSAYDSIMYGGIIQSAARRFEEKYPGTKINIQTFSQMPVITEYEGGGVGISTEEVPGAIRDYINRTGTELMSGAGADIFAHDVLPILDYIKAGQLENFDDFIAADKDFKVSDYQKEVLDAVNTMGGKWFMPLGYNLNLFAYDETLFSDAAKQKLSAKKAFSISEIIETAAEDFAKTPNSRMFSFANYEGGYEDLYSRLLEESYSRFIDISAGEAKFDTGEFENMLESVKSYGEQKVTSPQRDWGADFEEYIEMYEREAESRYFYKAKQPLGLLVEMLSNPDNEGMAPSWGEFGIAEDDRVFAVLSDSEGEVTTEPAFAFMINSDSKNKRLAWEFIKFLLSEEIQSTPMIGMMNLPLNNAAREAVFKEYITMLSGESHPEYEEYESAGEPEPDSDFEEEPEDFSMETFFDLGDPMGRDTKLSPAEQEKLDEFMALVELYSKEITSFKVRDTLADEIIEEETAQFFDGTKTAAETAAAIQSKISLYLSE